MVVYQHLSNGQHHSPYQEFSHSSPHLAAKGIYSNSMREFQKIHEAANTVVPSAHRSSGPRRFTSDPAVSLSTILPLNKYFLYNAQKKFIPVHLEIHAYEGFRTFVLSAHYEKTSTDKDFSLHQNNLVF